jgi:hypothetical protein
MPQGISMNSHVPLYAAVFSVLISCALESSAKPRTPSPPWPEAGSLFYEGFNQPYDFATNEINDTNIWAESWSGYSLNRTQLTVQPFTVPMINPGTNRTLNIDPERGAIRLWYQPGWSGGWTGQGRGPDDAARLITLVCNNDRASSEWWSLVVTPDGNELHLICESGSGSVSVLSTRIDWEAGTWHMLAVGYTPTNTALIVDGEIVATGDGIPSLPVRAMPYTSLVVGSDLNGNNPAQGHLEELNTFTGRSRFRSVYGLPFGMGSLWDVSYHFTNLSREAAKGPITPAEEAARRAQAAALKAERLASKEASLLVGSAYLNRDLEEIQLNLYDPSQGFRLSTPEVLQGTNILLTLLNCDTNIGYDVYYTPAIETNMTWSILATGHIGQTTFTVPMLGWQGFYRGAVGGDWDGDGILNWMDADPRSTNTGALTITIDSPLNGAVFQ